MRRTGPDSMTVPPNGEPEDQQPKWRKDFPIDIPQDEYVSRRDFTKYMVLISFAFVVGQCWILVKNALQRRNNSQEFAKEIARVDELAIGQVRVFEYPAKHDPCVLIRASETEFLAYSQKCTHLSCPVIPDPANSVFRCPCHEGMFEMKTGTPLAGPPRRPLPAIRLKIEGNKIYAVGEASPA